MRGGEGTPDRPFASSRWTQPAERRPVGGHPGTGRWLGLRVEITATVMISTLDRDQQSRRPSNGVGYLDRVTDEDLIAEAAHRLAGAAPEARVILFGSRARGEGRADSDLDLLVIERDLKSRRAEFVRLREALGDLGVPVDLIVVGADYAEQRAQVPAAWSPRLSSEVVSLSGRDPEAEAAVLALLRQEAQG